MTPDQILSRPSRVLTQAQREFYFENGYLCVEELVGREVLARLLEVTSNFVEESREVMESDEVYDLAPGHSLELPRLRRLKEPDSQHETYWSFSKGVIADVAADLVGPDVCFHHSKLNFKWHDGDDTVQWHQDIQFYPHTNYSPLAIGCYLEDTGPDDGPVAIIPRSHDGPLYELYDENGEWTGGLNDSDVASLNTSEAVYLSAPAGSITIHNSRTVHGSPSSKRTDGRPLLINAYASADAFAYTPSPVVSRHYRSVVRGKAARWAHHDPRPCLIPPDWSGGYTSIFAAQSGEESSTAVD
ncbi:MAG: phytanoyl-CoA dioxygenase [Rhodospirillaceae bacterium]|nr:phytanoyl-CoA dioxygenase [Rhodospirillaceae bacterium]